MPEWARAIRTGDLAAFEALFRHLQPFLLRMARQYADDATAADAVQETFARLWERRDRIDPDRSVRALLAQSVRNRLLNANRNASNRQALLDAQGHTADAPARPDDIAHHASLAERLRALLQALPERQQVAITLTRFEGLSHSEAAVAMDCSARTVNNHIVRGLRTLRERLLALDPDAL